MKPAVKLTIEKPAYGGDFLARRSEDPATAGKAIFVPLTLPEETVSAHIIEEKRTFAKAELDTVLSASPDRTAPLCLHFGACGGCHYQHASYPAQLGLKQQILRETLTRAGVDVPEQIGQFAAEPWQYRNRIRLAITSSGGLAYRGRRSHDLVPIHTCPIAAPLLLDTARRVAEFLKITPAPAPIAELELFTNHDQSQLLLTLFTQTESVSTKPAQFWLENLQAALPPQTTGIRLQLADQSLAPPVLAAVGEASLTYIAAGFSYRVEHGAFFQVNRHLLDEFINLVVPAERYAGQAWDLYAGAGLFARQLAMRGAQVTAVESAPASIAALNDNLADGQIVASTTLDFLRRNREQREPRPDLIVIDPPRAGLGDQVTHLLNAIHAPEMVYVSCDPATLARDLRQLTQERYRIESVTLADMFPQTFHLETVVRLRRT